MAKELVRAHLPDAESGTQSAGGAGVRLGDHDLVGVESVDVLLVAGSEGGRASQVHLEALGLELRSEAAHRGDDEVVALDVPGACQERFALDDQDAGVIRVTPPPALRCGGRAGRP